MRKAGFIISFFVLATLIIGGLLSMAGRGFPDADFVFVSAAPHKTLDPQQMSWIDEIRVAECLFEPLVKYTVPDLKIVAGVAERWEVEPTEQAERYTFHLRKGAKWSNGDTVTAHDFVYAWRRAMLPDFAAQYFTLTWFIRGAREFYDWRHDMLLRYEERDHDKSAEAASQLWAQTLHRFRQTVGLRAVDDRTLAVELIRPTPFFLELCAFATFMPVHRASVEAFVEGPDPMTGRMKQNPWVKAGKVVCNGPYVLTKRKIKEYLLMQANPHFWNSHAMGNGSILEKIIENPHTALLVYDQDEAHWLPDIPTAKTLAADLVAANRPDVHVLPAAGTYYYLFNCAAKRPDGSTNPLADRRVRLALSMVIDRKHIVESVTRLNQPIARTFTPCGQVPGYAPPVETGVSFDPKQATRLLAKAGFADGRTLRGLSILYNTGQGHEQIAQHVQQSWRKHLGVHVALEGIEKKVFSDRRRKHQFSIARGGWFGDYRDPTTFLDVYRTSSGQNDGQYSNKTFDKLLDQAMAHRNPHERLSILRHAEVVMLRDQPIAPIFQYVELHVFDPKRVKGIAPNAWHRRRLELVKVVPRGS